MNLLMFFFIESICLGLSLIVLILTIRIQRKVIKTQRETIDILTDNLTKAKQLWENQNPPSSKR